MAFENLGTVADYDNLFAGVQIPALTKVVTANADMKRGTLLL